MSHVAAGRGALCPYREDSGRRCAGLKVPLLGNFGGEDQGISPESVREFERKAKAKGKTAGGGAAHVVVRRAREGERIVDIGGREHRLLDHDLVVCSGPNVVSVAGVIGGEDTGVVADTRTVLLEAATWDGPSIRATSRTAIPCSISFIARRRLRSSSSGLPRGRIAHLRGTVCDIIYAGVNSRRSCVRR